jgi:hypothetical protein
MTRSLQEWVHWLEVGDGALWLRRAVFVTGVLILSGLAACVAQAGCLRCVPPPLPGRTLTPF